MFLPTTLEPANGDGARDVGAALQAALETARDAGLRYVSASSPGLRRIRTKTGFGYRSAEGKPVRAARDLERIRRLAIPPAWENVWICADPRGHLQATGRDARGRKQYRYHAEWRSVRDANKYERLAEFGLALNRIRAQVARDLELPGLPRNKVIAAVVRLLETTFIRVGNERYVRANGSYGLTTMRNKHVRLNGQTIKFQFLGKSRRQHAIEMTDARLARILRRCRELPGYELFRYIDAGEIRTVESSDVNAYLQAVAGGDYSAKDFRTWGGSVIAMQAFERKYRADPGLKGLDRRAVNEVIGAVAAQLGNTVTVCRKCYIHPEVIRVFSEAGKRPRPKPLPGLRAPESRLLALLIRARA